MHAVVIGLAETGVAVTRRLRSEGWEVTVVEDAPSTSDAYADRAMQSHCFHMLNDTVSADVGLCSEDARVRMSG